MAGIGVIIAKKVPPPGKLKGKSGGYDESDEEDTAPDDEEAENEAAAHSQMQEVLDAVKGGDAAEACRALDAYLESAGFVRR